MAPPPLPVESAAASGQRPWLARWQQPLLSLQTIALASLVATGFVLGARVVGLLQSMELALYDQQLRLRPAAGIDDRLLVVGITETDIQQRQEWPITDRTVADLLTVLEAHQPRLIGLDLFRDVPLNPGHADLMDHMASSDRLMAVCKMSSPDDPGVAPPAGLPAERVGFSDVVVDAGGILRRSLLLASPPEFGGQRPNVHLCNTPGNQLLALSFQLVLAYLAAEKVPVSQTEGGDIQLGNTVLKRLQPSTGGYRGADAQGYQILLNYRSAEPPAPVVSLSDLLSGQVDPELIRDRIVLVGYTTPQAKDDFYTPYSEGERDSQKMPGVLVHAQAISQLLSAVLDNRPLLWTWSEGGETLWIFLWALAGAALAWWVRRPVWFLLMALGLVAGLYGVAYGWLLLGAWIPLAPPLLSLGLASGLVLLLDRFNRSDYGQAMYRQVKTLLRLEVSLDQGKVGQQVAEITGTEYFSDLQQQAKTLRQQRQSFPAVTDEAAAVDGAAADPAAADSGDLDDYLQRLRQQARDLQPGAEAPPPSESLPEDGHRP